MIFLENVLYLFVAKRKVLVWAVNKQTRLSFIETVSTEVNRSFVYILVSGSLKIPRKSIACPNLHPNLTEFANIFS